MFRPSLRDAYTIYKREGYGMLYVCPKTGCDAYVGVHNGTSKPKGPPFAGGCCDVAPESESALRYAGAEVVMCSDMKI